MSTLKDNIRRIAETEELKKLIAELLNEGDPTDYASIKARLYFARAASGGGINGSTGAPSSGVGSLDPQVQNTDSSLDSDGGDIFDELGEAIDNLFGFEDAQNIFDNGLKIGDKLNGITGFFDCDTGEEARISFKGFVPPNIANLDDYSAADWGNGNDPREDQWRSGVYYEFTVLTTHKASNPYAAVEAGLSEYDSNDPPNAPHTLVSIADYDVDAVGDGSTLTATLNRTSGQFTANITVRKTGCTVGVDAWCPSEKPVGDWPEDGIHDLNFDGAQFETNNYEPLGDQNPDWQNNPSKISGCTSGGDQMSLEPTQDGGLIINIDSGVNAGDSYILDGNGTVIDKVTDTSPYTPTTN